MSEKKSIGARDQITRSRGRRRLRLLRINVVAVVIISQRFAADEARDHVERCLGLVWVWGVMMRWGDE